MGQSIHSSTFSKQQYRDFSRRLQENLQAFEQLLKIPGFGQGHSSLGAELEVYLVDQDNLPAFHNIELWKKLDDPLLTLELNRYNLEYNFEPIDIDSAPFSVLEQQINAAMKKLKAAASEDDLKVLAIGILPSLRGADIGDHAMTDLPRYHALTEGLKSQRKNGQFDIHINGVDTLDLQAHTLTLEGANTSMQIHYRVDPTEFADLYNALQLVSPIMVALSANSPTFLGHQLWQETRIALFKQAIDSRNNEHDWKEPARVAFGHGWIRRSAYDIFAEGVNLFPPLLPIVDYEDALDLLKKGETPGLHELRLHQGSIWQWNRPIYDPVDGGHLRIEMRALPAGPSALDMAANAAFYIGLAEGLKPEINHLLPAMPFAYAERNFYTAAKKGMKANLIWPCDSGTGLANKPVLEIAKQLLPVARRGLESINIGSHEIDRMLGIIEERIETQTNGSAWQLAMLDKFQQHCTLQDSLSMLVDRYIIEAESGRPVAQWGQQL